MLSTSLADVARPPRRKLPGETAEGRAIIAIATVGWTYGAVGEN